jgi:hypothetical protein
MISSYYRGAQGVILGKYPPLTFVQNSSSILRLVYDVCRRETFESLNRWFTELDRYLSSSVVRIIVGNKVDNVCACSFVTKRNRLTHMTYPGILAPGIDSRRTRFRVANELALHRGVCKDRSWCSSNFRQTCDGNSEDTRPMGAHDFACTQTET